MKTHEKALDYLARDELDTAELRQRGGVEEVGTRAGRTGLGAEFGHGSQGSYRWIRVLSTVPGAPRMSVHREGCVIPRDSVSSTGDATSDLPLIYGKRWLARVLPKERW